MPHHRTFVFALVFVGLLLPAALLAEDWPGWRGPTGLGQSQAKDLPLTWGGKTPENVLWKTPLYENDKVRKDQNQSSPIVVGDKVIVTLSYWADANDKEYPEHHVLCFAAADGKKLWDTKVPPGPWLLKDLRGGYTAPTPASDGERVYAVFGSSVIAGLDLKGKLLWKQDITPFNFDVAIGASPIVHKDTVLFVADQLKEKKTSFLIAYDGKTGNVRYLAERPTADWAHSTPVLAAVGGKTVLLVGSANGPQGVDPDSGKTLWWYTTARVGDTVSPVLGGGVVYLDSGRGGPGVAVDPSGEGDISKTGAKWKVTSIPEGFSSPVAVGDLLYRAHSPGVVNCRKLSDGSEVFKERLEGLDPAISPIATADGRIYFASSGKSYVLKAGPKLEVLGASDLGDPSRASPAIAGDRLYLKGGRNLYCIGTKK